MIKNVIITLVFCLIGCSTFSQKMTQIKLSEIISKMSDTVEQQNNVYKFVYNNALLLCMIDEKANRMRVILPIVEVSKLSDLDLKNALIANFHTALDVKYAISDDILWSVFIHPLKALSEQQVEDAILQVYRASATFGSTYSSTDLIFPGSLQTKENKVKEKLLKKT